MVYNLVGNLYVMVFQYTGCPQDMAEMWTLTSSHGAKYPKYPQHLASPCGWSHPAALSFPVMEIIDLKDIAELAKFSNCNTFRRWTILWSQCENDGSNKY